MIELGKAYDHWRAGHRRDAVTVLRPAVAARPDEARRKLRDLEAVVEARSSGGQCGCHVSRTLRDLLHEAIHG